MQTLTIDAIYENGVLRPLEPLQGLSEHNKVRITIESEKTKVHPLLQFAGILSNEEAAALQAIIEEEFEKVDPNAW